MRRMVVLLIVLAILSPVQADELGLKLPPGFKATLWADQDMANDIYAMTLDEDGNVTVTSRGWVKLLSDTKNCGKADTVQTLINTPTGGMGICWSHGDLYFCGDGWFSRYAVVKNGPVPNKPTERILPLQFSEHGGHAMRLGPDDCWYIVYGNVSAIENVKLDPSSPIKKPQAGGILRISGDLKKIQCIATGFRNPYDFDFTPNGDIITYDSDTERDFLLPWYSPTRMYHVAYGMHHGWRLPGHLQSLARRDYYPDTVDILAPVGRGSPTGVVCYRHDQFPEHYRGGIFALDWTFGKIYFFHLDPNGSSYKTKAEVFLEPAGINGFAPTDACVAPDGSLFISIGGRGTRGAVYRIEYVGTAEAPRRKRQETLESLSNKLVDGFQPLDEFSRKERRHQMGGLPKEHMSKFIGAEKRDPSVRVRAIEILVERYNTFELKLAEATAKDPHWSVRSRTAWALTRTFHFEGANILLDLARDTHPKVRVEALTSIADAIDEKHWPANLEVVAIIAENLGNSDKRVRMAACRLILQLDAKAWLKLQSALQTASLKARLTFALSDFWHEATGSNWIAESFAVALEGLKSSDAELRLDALRLLMLIDGDWCLRNPPDVVYSAYALQKPRKDRREIETKIAEQIHKLYPTGDAHFDHEASRYFAMIEDGDAGTAEKILERISKASPATEDVHHLIVLSRLKSKHTPEQTAAVVDALLGLERKLQGQQLRIKQTWGPRLGEVVSNLQARFPGTTEAILKHPDFVNPAHVAYTAGFAIENQKKAARLFLNAVNKDAEFLWSAELIDLLATLPAKEYRPVFRGKWTDYSLRDAILKYLVENPEPADRALLLDGLDSSDRTTLLACIAALQKLPGEKSASNLVLPLRRLRLSLLEPKDAALRAKLLALVNHLAGAEFVVNETSTEPLKLKTAFSPLYLWFEEKHPDEAKLLRGDEEDGEHWKKRLGAVTWEMGVPDRGMKLFRERSCAVCHTGTSRIGPDLTGVAGRFSRDDLFNAILYPSRDVAPAYRVNDIETQDGKNYSGIVIFEAAEGIIVQTGAATTIRIDSANLVSRKPSTKSLMPAGLLKDLKPEDLADLYSYLKSLK